MRVPELVTGVGVSLKFYGFVGAHVKLILLFVCSETESSCGTNEANESPSRHRTMSVGAFGGSLESTTSTETVGSLQDSNTGTPAMNRTKMRLEVMRHVECMSNPIWVKPCQQSLLQ